MVTNWDRPDSLHKLSKLLCNHLYGAHTKAQKKKKTLEVELGALHLCTQDRQKAHTRLQGSEVTTLSPPQAINFQ